MSFEDEVFNLLRDLTVESPEIDASMVAKKGLDGIIVFPEDFKREVIDVWEPLSANINDQLTLVQKYCYYGLSMAVSQMVGYVVLFMVLGESDTALVVFFKEPVGLKGIEDKMDRVRETRDRILRMVEEK